jgi:transposase
MEYIAFDSHEHYTLASVARPNGQLVREQRLPHERGALQRFLARCEPGSPVAVETIGNWYWIVDEIEAAGCIPKLVHARKAKLMMGEINKTDKLDVRRLNQLQRNGTLPTVWIPPGELRDQRDLPRTRMVLVRQRTQLKNRIHATLAKYALHDLKISDLFGTRGRALLRQRLELLPPCTAYATQQLLEQVENLDRHVRGFEHQIQTVFKPAPAIQLLLTLPGVGLTLAVVIALEIGNVGRFRHRREARRLRGHHAARPRERREDPLWAVPPRRQSLLQVGVRRSGKRHLPQSRPRAAPPRQSPLRAHRPAQGPPESHRRRRPTSGRSDVLDPHETRVLSGTEGRGRFVDGG